MTVPINVNIAKSPPRATDRVPEQYGLTNEQYEAMIRHGIVDENDRIELIQGQLLEKMPVGKRHIDCVDKINVYFVLRYGLTHKCSTQQPLVVAASAQSEPDYAIINKGSYEQRKGKAEAEDALLLIEVSDTTLHYDRTIKAPLYAETGIPEYWIVNLQEDKVEIYLEPNTSDGTFGFVRHYGRETAFDSPFCGKVLVSDLLPEPEAEEE